MQHTLLCLLRQECRERPQPMPLLVCPRAFRGADQNGDSVSVGAIILVFVCCIDDILFDYIRYKFSVTCINK